ncbi:MAG: hypothetical protein D6748_08840 [Calditrichaeota bacterium]|nr:MAG: hypothetical protein D6748_08840 [Calditrichota bacterium]
MEKIDFKKKFRDLYHASAQKVQLVNVPALQFLMIDGKGDPNQSVDFQDGVETLFSISYTLKFKIVKKRLGIDYGVMPLEGLWWSDTPENFDLENKSSWLWTIMIMQPDFITSEMMTEALDIVAKSKKLQGLQKVRFETFHEGTAVQLLHVGPFSEEGPTVQRLHRFAQENGYQLRGKHHEIYLSDYRKTVPERLKTIIRQPIQPQK